jgi:YVTN family beta-propeller protein
MAVSRDGAFLYVTHGVNPGTISIVDTATFSVVDTMNVGAGPYSIVMAAIDTSGDFNRNGDVDAGDYLTWRKSFGMTVTNGAEADGNRDGVVDASDYIIWRKNLQANSGSDNAHLPVPEPHALTLALLGGIAAIASLRSRDRNY